MNGPAKSQRQQRRIKISLKDAKIDNFPRRHKDDKVLSLIGPAKLQRQQRRIIISREDAKQSRKFNRRETFFDQISDFEIYN